MAHCIYHGADLDGHASAAVIRYRHPQIKMIPIDYGDEFPLERILNEDKYPVVFMVDFCPSDMSIVEQLIDNCAVFVWIDHHVSSIEEFKRLGLGETMHEGCVAYLDENHESYAACELAFQWLFSVDYDKIPYYFKLLGRYDVFDHSDPNTLPFQYGMRAWLPDPKDDMSKWKKLIQNTAKDQEVFEKMLDRGKYIVQYEGNKNAAKAKAASFDLTFQGYRAIACNEMFTNHKFFDAVWSDDRHDLMISFGWNKDYWRISLYTLKEEVDILSICKEFSGGGHAKACGFQCNELPKELKEAMNGD